MALRRGQQLEGHHRITLQRALLIIRYRSLALEIKYSVENLAASFQSYRLDNDRKAALERRTKILESLSPTNPSINHHYACKKYQQGTGNWLLQRAEYLEWTAKRGSILWINGIPGCGKTILCSTIIESLLKRQLAHNSQSGVAYFYFNFQNRAEQQFINLLRSLILQLSCQCQKLPGSVERLHQQLRYQYGQPNMSSSHLIGILKDVCLEFRDVYIVTDALDECEQYEELVEWVEDLTNGNSIVHLLLSSRQTQQFRELIGPLATAAISVNDSIPTNDIQLHIREQLKSDPRMKKWPADLHDEIEGTLTANVDGS
jgi:NACHT domain